jgi:signal transduction histidine kinase
MQSLQETTGQETAARHARFLSNVSRHLMSLDLDPMLEAVAHAALPLLGDICAIDRGSGGGAIRLLEVRSGSDTWVEPPEELTAVTRAEIRLEGGRSRLTVPITLASERFGVFTFIAKGGLVHGPAELSLGQELADRLALAIQNVNAHAQLKEALGERERLISIAAHELRGPVCSLRLCVQALRRMERKERKTTSNGGRLLEIMDREERRLARLIDELLDLARLRTGQFRLDLQPVDLCDIVREVASRLTMEAGRRGSKLEVEMSGSSLVGQWDRSRLDQVVTNLVANAIKFGQQRPIVVSVGTDPTGTCARLTVTDHGLGIDPEAQQRIFEPFKRAAAHRTEGLGLGLYIVRNIVGQLGGIVRVKSAPGRGATFTVELPLDVQNYASASATG